MRVAIIAPPWVSVPPRGYGGTEVVLDALARGLQDAGHEVLLFTTGDSTCDVPRRWVREVAAGTDAASPAIEIHHVIHAYDAVRSWNADVVHDHTMFGPLYGAASGLPLVATNHGPFDRELRDIYRTIAERAAVVAISHHHASTAAEVPISAVIHHGVEIDSFPTGAGDGGYALFLGRMSPDKGVHTAARVAAATGTPLRIAAKMREPAEFEYFNNVVAPLLGGQVEYVGEVATNERLELLAGASCLLNPIDWPEPFGMVMVEALACGTPVIATPHGSVPEIVIDGETGFVCDGEAELVAALARVGEIDRARCRADATARFSAGLMVARHVQAYRSAMEPAALVPVPGAHSADGDGHPTASLRRAVSPGSDRPRRTRSRAAPDAAG